jgi:hypothetical protein
VEEEVMERAFLPLVVLLLIFALVLPILVFKATGLTVYELATGTAPLPKVESYVFDALFITPKVYGEFAQQNVPDWFKSPDGSIGVTGAPGGGGAIEYTTYVRSPGLFSDELAFVETPKEWGAVFEKEGMKWIYAGHFPGYWTDSAVGVRIWTGDARNLFDFPLPGSLVSPVGFTGKVITDNETAVLAATGTLAELKAKILGFLDQFRAGKISTGEIDAGFQLEKLPVLRNAYSIYGVFQVPVYIEFWGERPTLGPPCGIPDADIYVEIIVPSQPPFGIGSLNSLGIDLTQIENFQIVGIYNCFPLSSFEKLRTTVGGLESLERYLIDAVKVRTLQAIPKEWRGITGAYIQVSPNGRTWEVPAPELEVKFFDIDILRGKVSLTPKLEVRGQSSFFDYEMEVKNITKNEEGETSMTVLIRIIRPRKWQAFTYDDFDHARITLCIPVVWTAQVTFSLPSEDELGLSVSLWDNALRRLGFSDLDILNRLQNSLKEWESMLREEGLTDVANRVKEFLDNLNSWLTGGRRPEDIVDNTKNTLPKLIFDVIDEVRSAELPSLTDILGRYALPLTRIEYVPDPAHFPTPEEIAMAAELNIPVWIPEPHTLELPEPVGYETPDVVFYNNEIPTPEIKTVKSEKSATQPYERPYTASMYARDVALMVAVVLGSLGAGLLALRLLRGRAR